MTLDPKRWEGSTAAPWAVEPGTTVIWNVFDDEAPGTLGYGVPIAKAEIPYGNPPLHIEERRKVGDANARLIADAPALAAAYVAQQAEIERLRAIVSSGLYAVNAAYEQARAELQDYNHRAAKFDSTVQAWRTCARAALSGDAS